MDMEDEVELGEQWPQVAALAGEAVGGWAADKALEKTLKRMNKGGSKVDFSNEELASIFQIQDDDEMTEGYDRVSKVINNYFKISKDEKS